MGKEDTHVPRWFIVAGLIFLNIILYANTLFNGFVSDDIAAIVQNPGLAEAPLIDFKNFSPAFSLTVLTYRLVGLSPRLYHFNNVVLHIVNTVLVFYLIDWLGFDNKISHSADAPFEMTKQGLVRNSSLLFAALTAGLFALHPIHTEPVNWISGLPYLLYTLFSLMTVLMIVGIDRGRLKKWWLVFIPLTSSLAYVSSEKSLVLPLIVLSYFFLVSKIKRGWWSLAAVTLPGVLFFIKLTGRFGGRVEASNPGMGSVPTIFNPLIQIPVAIGTYLKLWIVPFGLTLYHEFILTKLELAGYVVALILFFIFIGFLIFKKQKLLLWGISLFFIGLFPTLLPIRIAWIAAERYAYLPSLGLFMIEAVILLKLYQKQKIIFGIVMVGLVLFYASITIKRTFDWRDPDTFWKATVIFSPRSSMAHNNIGEYYYRHGDIDGAIREFTIAQELNPDSAEATYNLGNLYLEANDSTHSAEYFEKAFSLDQKFLDAALAAVVANLRLGKTERAQQYLTKAQSLPLEFPRDYNNWGVLYLSLGQKEKAREMFRKALEIDPTFELARQNLQLVQ